jgi:hypothetical protein
LDIAVVEAPCLWREVDAFSGRLQAGAPKREAFWGGNPLLGISRLVAPRSQPLAKAFLTFVILTEHSQKDGPRSGFAFFLIRVIREIRGKLLA